MRVADLERVPVLRCVILPFTRPTRGGTAFMAALALAVAASCVLVRPFGPWDPDGWFILGTGRWIAAHGIPRVNPWAIDPKPVVIQQWLHDLWVWACWRAGGWAGAQMSAAVPAALAACSVWALSGTVSGNRSVTPARLAACACAVVPLAAVMSVRPALWTVAALCATVCVCTSARRAPALYLLLPLITLVHVNLHAAMWPLPALAAACFLLPMRWPGRDAATGAAVEGWVRSRTPLLLAIFGMTLASLANPYGIDGALYVARSMGAASYRNVISEMWSTPSAFGAALILHDVVALAPAAAAAASARRRPSPALSALALALLVEGHLHARSFWMVGIAGLIITSDQLGALAPAKRAGASRSRALPFALIALTMATAMGAAVAVAPARPQSEMVATTTPADTISRLSPIAERVKDDPALTGRAGFAPEASVGNFLEWAGVRMSYDFRPEIWEPGITGDPKSRGWRDLVDGTMSTAVLGAQIENGTWSWAVVRTDGQERAVLGVAPGWRVLMRSGGFSLLGPA